MTSLGPAVTNVWIIAFQHKIQIHTHSISVKEGKKQEMESYQLKSEIVHN